MDDALIVFAAAFLGSAVQTVVGFGLVIFLMAIVPLFLPVGTCLVVSQVAGVFMSIVLIFGKTKSIDRKKVIWPTLFASAGSIAGLIFLGKLDNALYMKLLGIILVALALWMLKFSSMVKIRPTPLSGSITGGIGGIMGSLFGVSAPPMVLYYSSVTESKDAFVASLQFSLCVQTGVCLLGRVAMDMWPSGSGILLLPAVAGAFLGKFPGQWLYNRLDLKTFRLLVYIFTGLLGVYIFLSN